LQGAEISNNHSNLVEQSLFLPRSYESLVLFSRQFQTILKSKDNHPVSAYRRLAPSSTFGGTSNNPRTLSTSSPSKDAAWRPQPPFSISNQKTVCDPILPTALLFNFKCKALTLTRTFHPAEKGKPYPLSQHRGKVVLVVNTASKCGFTPQLKALESLNKTMSTKHPDEFVILGFPCNQFAGQEPDDKTQSSCLANYGVTFPILDKTEVNGDNSEPVWGWMKKQWPWGVWPCTFESVMWNFEKFLIGRDGKVVQRWTSVTKPGSLTKAIEAELAKGKTTKAGKVGEGGL
jgi:peroxiredoxin